MGPARGISELGDLGALTDGFSAAFVVAVVIALVGAALAALTLRGSRVPASELESVTILWPGRR